VPIVTRRTRDAASEGPPSVWRYWGSRLGLAFGSTLGFLVVLEVLVSAVWGPVFYPLPRLDEAAHYLHFTLPERFNPLFELHQDEDGPHMHTVPDLYSGEGYFVKQQRFPAQRDESALRIAFMGGSSVQGWPWREDGVVFPELVAADMTERFPGRRFDVINAGVGSYSSFQLVDVAWQLEAYRPDVVVIYAGHNDQGYYFFNRAFLDQVASGGASGGSLARFLNRFNFYQQGRRLRDRLFAGAGEPTASSLPPGSSHAEPSERDAVRGRPEAIVPETAFIPQDERIAEIGEQRYIEWVRIQQDYLPQIFEANLRAVAARLRAAGVQVVLALPTSNLRDYPPAFSMFFEPVSSSSEHRFLALLEQASNILDAEGLHARSLPSIEGNGEFMVAAEPWGPLPISGAPELGSEIARARCAEVLTLLASAREISETYARLHYLEGLCLLHSDVDAAREAFVRARRLSPAMAPKQRAGEPLGQAMRRVAQDLSLPLVDLPAAFAAASDLGITDGRLFVDNLHFSQEGHRVAAEAIGEALSRLPLISEGPGPQRSVDPGPEELQRILRDRARNPQWGLDIHVPGANEPYKDDSGVSELPGHQVEQLRKAEERRRADEGVEGVELREP